MFKWFPLFLALSGVVYSAAHAQSMMTSADSTQASKKNYIEDIFIWKISDELKLSPKEEKLFSETTKKLNKKKFDLMREIQASVTTFSDKTSDGELKKYRKLLQSYNQLSVEEFDSVIKIFSPQKMVQYLKIKSELNTKMKSLLAGDTTEDKNTGLKKNPKPQVIIER